MIVVTGAAGFIGSNVVAELSARGEAVAAVDVERDATPYLSTLKIEAFVGRDALLPWCHQNRGKITAVIHMGACSDTTCPDREFLLRNNFAYTRGLWNFCAEAGVRLIYASSAATYGDGSHGYDDRGDPEVLQPLNFYGESKQLFDLWALNDVKDRRPVPNGWAGLKFFNVYGPREDHKGRMASVAFHAYHQIAKTGKVRLFASDRAGIPDGGQQRDFIYVKDVVDAILHCAEAQSERIGALFNVGTGKMRSFADLTRAVFAAMGRPANIEYFEMPADLKGKYQYATEARVEKLRASGFTQPFRSLEEGVREYVNYLREPQIIA